MDGITDLKDVSLSKLQEMKDREALRAAVHGVTKSQTPLRLNINKQLFSELNEIVHLKN